MDDITGVKGVFLSVSSEISFFALTVVASTDFHILPFFI